jgi:hypothetical protein
MLFKNKVVVPDIYTIKIMFAHLHAGELKSLTDTNKDLQVSRTLDHVLSATGGIDHNYCINQSSHEDLFFVAR